MNPTTNTNEQKLTKLLHQNETRPAVAVDKVLLTDTSVWKDSTHESLAHLCSFKKILAANRGEIAVRICRAATELNVKSATIYAFEDRNSAHRWDSDESYILPASGTPVGAYLNIENIINVAKENGIDAIHPGYGFLSESAEFAKACKDAKITFVGPSVENLQMFGDKTKARELAINAGVSVVPGTSTPLTTSEEAVEFVSKYNLPIMVS
jgi:pyruvate carboxylase